MSAEAAGTGPDSIPEPDPEFLDGAWFPLLSWLQDNWFHLRVHGAENIPPAGPALLVANHSGGVPLDALMVQATVYRHSGRIQRLLAGDVVYALPGLGSLADRVGAVRAGRGQARALLDRAALVGAFPEGYRGLGKSYAQRYQLQRFGRGGFAAVALAAGVPIVPVAVVGAEEAYPQLGHAFTGRSGGDDARGDAGSRVDGSVGGPLARSLGLPYLPVTPTFPWLGAAGLMPLPSRWTIDFLPPIDSRQLGSRLVSDVVGQAPPLERDPVAVLGVSAHVRELIQERILLRLRQRRSAFR